MRNTLLVLAFALALPTTALAAPASQADAAAFCFAQEKICGAEQTYGDYTSCVAALTSCNGAHNVIGPFQSDYWLGCGRGIYAHAGDPGYGSANIKCPDGGLTREFSTEILNFCGTQKNINGTTSYPAGDTPDTSYNCQQVLDQCDPVERANLFAYAAVAGPENTDATLFCPEGVMSRGVWCGRFATGCGPSFDALNHGNSCNFDIDYAPNGIGAPYALARNTPYFVPTQVQCDARLYEATPLGSAYGSGTHALYYTDGARLFCAEFDVVCGFTSGSASDMLQCRGLLTSMDDATFTCAVAVLEAHKAGKVAPVDSAQACESIMLDPCSWDIEANAPPA